MLTRLTWSRQAQLGGTREPLPAVKDAMRPPVAGEIVLTFSDQGEGGTSARVSVPVDEIMRQAKPLMIRQAEAATPGQPELTVRRILDPSGRFGSSTIHKDAALETTLMRAFEDTERLRLAVTSTHDPRAALPGNASSYRDTGFRGAGHGNYLWSAQSLIRRASASLVPADRTLLVAASSPTALASSAWTRRFSSSSDRWKSTGDGFARIKAIKDATRLSAMNDPSFPAARFRLRGSCRFLR